MLRTKTYDYRNKVLDYGFVELKPNASFISIEALAEAVRESLILVDTRKLFILDALKRIESYLNQSERILVGLTNDNMISELRKSGVKNGFFRSTNEDFYVGIIVADKKHCYLVLDVDHIYPVQDRYVPEIFGYVNHILWSKANYEQCQDALKRVEDTKLSVVIPEFLDDDTSLGVDIFEMATESEDSNRRITILSKESDFKKPAKVAPYSFDGLSIDKKSIYIKSFLENYYPIPLADGSFFKAESFENQTLQTLFGKEIWYKGKIQQIKENDELNVRYNVPLDQEKLFIPDFDEKEKEYTELTLSLTVKCEIVPIKLDGSYALSNKYKVIERVNKELKEGIDRLKKLNLEVKFEKQVKSIEEERNLTNKIKMYNAFVSNKEIGVDALNNKKSQIPTIKVNEEELVVPNELIGKLYTKNNNNYLATSVERLEDAKKWLSDNRVAAVLIEA